MPQPSGAAIPNPYETIADAVAVIVQEARAVPPQSIARVCPFCFGCKDEGYSQCFGCRNLLGGGAPRSLLQRTVPMSIAPAPGAWYSRMQTYKALSPENMPLLAAMVHTFFEMFSPQMATLLGGPPDAVCITPSKQGRRVSEQRLRRLLDLIEPDLPPIEDLLRHNAAVALGHNEFNADAFIADPAMVGTKRVILLEDTWVTGSTATSAATALERAGATVAIMPIARRIDTPSVAGRHGNDCDYLAAIARPWNMDNVSWPRP